ncbi:signal peptidase I [alpha proteobacterium U9-1i]|nr:signal peptidase I [alpha proteobacterium U9-1i]
MQKIRAEIVEWVRVIAGALVVYLGITTVAFAQYSIPSESMVPTLEVGDRVIVSKFAYGYSRQSLPLNIGALFSPGERRLFEQMPRRGDVVVFTHPMDGKVMIKRLIGLPGDVIEVRSGRLMLNGEMLPVDGAQQMVREAHDEGREWITRSFETLPGGVRHVVHDRGESDFDTFGPYTVPPRHVFFMGDNRDNSLDSRWDGMGPVPIDNLIGRAETVFFAPRNCSGDPTVSCARSRWLKPLHD